MTTPVNPTHQPLVPICFAPETTIGAKVADSVAENLNANAPVGALRFPKCQVTDEAAAKIFGALKDNHTVADLRFLFSPLSATVMEHLSEALAENQTVILLEFSGCQLTEEALKQLSAALKANETLKGLTLQMNALSAKGAEVLAEGLAANRSLQVIRLEACGLDENTCTPVINALKSHEGVISVTLNGNPIGVQGAMDVQELLMKNQNLMELGLGQCAIPSTGISAIAEGVRANPSLQALTLSLNPLVDEENPTVSGADLAELLRAGEGLQVLELNSCKINDAAAQAMSAGLRDCPASLCLKAVDNPFGKEGEQALGTAMGESRAVKRLFYDHGVKFEDGTPANGYLVGGGGIPTTFQVTSTAERPETE